MASELRVNTLKDASGNNSVATSTVFSGSAKSWLNFNGTGTIAILDSFNIGSLSDAGTGLYNSVFVSNMNNNDFSASCAAGENDDSGGNRSLGLRAKATTGCNCRGFRDGVSADDVADMNVTIHGDLA